MSIMLGSILHKLYTALEIHNAWQIISEQYEINLRQAVETMPLACLVASETPVKTKVYYVIFPKFYLQKLFKRKLPIH